ncbi:MAG: alpha-E domain-containing protein [Alphaproteobacteria bacterium]|nr:alpha-E domain-containing protein [Alphaproteobacteria bacterium]
MLGKTAGGLFWMFRYLERSENTARLIEAGFRMALTRSAVGADEWKSIVTAAGVRSEFEARYSAYETQDVIDFLLRDPDNSSSVKSSVEAARINARLVRIALTREVWEATNECWMTLTKVLAEPIPERDLPAVLGTIRQQSALVRGALHGTMLRNDIYDFARIGTFIERGDSTARILDVKYYVLLPSISYVGSSLDNVQWETILRSVSAHRSYRWLNGGEITPKGIANFLILDRRMPRSLAFCAAKLAGNLAYLADDYGERHSCHELAEHLRERLRNNTIDMILEDGLHEFVQGFIRDNIAIGNEIERNYRFTG